MIKHSSLVALLFLGAFNSLIAPINVSAESVRIAIVDMDRVLNESKEAKVKRGELEKIKSAKQKTLEAQKTTLTKLEKTLKDKKVSTNSKEADDFRAQARDFTRKAKDAEEDLKRKYLASTKILITKAQGIINKYAAAEKLNLVLERGKEQSGAVLYSSNVLDITDEIIKQMNAG